MKTSSQASEPVMSHNLFRIFRIDKLSFLIVLDSGSTFDTVGKQEMFMDTILL